MLSRPDQGITPILTDETVLLKVVTFYLIHQTKKTCSKHKPMLKFRFVHFWGRTTHQCFNFETVH